MSGSSAKRGTCPRRRSRSRYGKKTVDKREPGKAPGSMKKEDSFANKVAS